MIDIKVSVSILGIKDNLSKIEEIENTTADYIHLDVMDGKFVSNETNMLRIYNKKLDVHLMVEDVKSYIDQYKLLNPEYITFHYEAVEEPIEMINYIHSLGIRAGLSINPDTNVENIIPYLNNVELILVMSVVPGEGGQKYIESSTQKINYLKELKKKNLYKYEIEVDGGINADTIKLANNADIFVIGSYITSSEDYEEKIREIKSNI